LRWSVELHSSSHLVPAVAIEGEPADMVRIVNAHAVRPATGSLGALLANSAPGAILGSGALVVGTWKGMLG
jgi:hypothetical protein